MPLSSQQSAAIYAKRLEELYLLVNHPLQTIHSDVSLDTKHDIRTFVKSHAITGSEPLDFESLTNAESDEQLESSIATKAHTVLSRIEAIETNRKRARESDSGSLHAGQKREKKVFPSRFMPEPVSKQILKPSAVKLKTHAETLEEDTNDFLNTPTADLDIVALPEHYPTTVHNVSSLAELYYLTQTLPLIKLLPGSHKTLMTENFELALLEGKIAVLYSRIEELKRQKKWSLRQPIRYLDPFVYSSPTKPPAQHTWDSLLQEGKWMATDMRESAKFKKLCCVQIAQAVQDFWTYGTIMCVKRKQIAHLPENQVDVEMTDADAPLETAEPSEPYPDLVPSNTSDEEDPESIFVSKLMERPDPSIDILPFSFPDIDEEVAKQSLSTLRKPSPFKAFVHIADLDTVDQSIINNLPAFTAFESDSQSSTDSKALPTLETQVVPVSRMLHPLPEDEGWYKIVLKNRAPSEEAGGLTSSSSKKGLFGSQSHRKFNFLRPPKPPLIKNIDYRSPTIWLPQDDKHLIHFVAEFCFNWDLIAENLQSTSASLKCYESNIERRTPWQCFERYIQLNEKFQFSDMKGHNAYQAQQWLELAHKAQSTTKRRISPLGVGNESIQRGHRRLRWASMFDAMRKAMRKREAAAAKAGHRKTTSSDVTGPAASSTVPGYNGNGATKRGLDRIPTPSELAKLKFDRDKSIQEAYAHQQATRSRMMAAVAQQKLLMQPLSSTGPTDVTDTTSPGMRNHRGVPQTPTRGQGGELTAANLQRTLGAGAAAGQAKPAVSSIKRPTTPNGTPYTVEQIQRLLQIQKQRKLMQQNQAAGRGVAAGSGVNPQASVPGSATRKVAGSAGQASQTYSSGGRYAASPGVMSAGATMQGGMSQGKRVGTPAKGRMQFAPAQVSAIINSIQQKNPNLTKDQVTKLAASYLANLQQQQQSRLEAAQALGSAPETVGGLSLAAQGRQAQLTRQRLAQASQGVPGKDLDGQSLSRMQYEERKKLMLQQGGSQYGQSSTMSSAASSPGHVNAQLSQSGTAKLERLAKSDT